MSDNRDLVLQIQLLSETARMPTRASAAAAGYDLYANEDVFVPPLNGFTTIPSATVRTGIAICVPEGTYGRIAPRSGLAVKHGISVGAGVIDRDYTGEVCVVLFNHSSQQLCLQKGDCVAQLILERIVTPEAVQVDNLSKTDRGTNGFGSTGR